MKVYNDQLERLRSAVESLYDEERGVGFDLTVEECTEMASVFDDPFMAQKMIVVLQGRLARR